LQTYFSSFTFEEGPRRNIWSVSYCVSCASDWWRRHASPRC
jgi:hypothetical protein